MWQYLSTSGRSYPNYSDIVLSPARNLQVITVPNYLCCMGILCMQVKLLTDLLILGCELHKNAFGGWTPPGPAAGAIVLPHIAVIRGEEGRKGNERAGNRGRGRKGGKGRM